MLAAAAQEQLPTDQAKFVSEFTAQVLPTAEKSSMLIQLVHAKHKWRYLTSWHLQALFNYLSCTAWATSQMMAHTAVQQTLMVRT